MFVLFRRSWLLLLASFAVVLATAVSSLAKDPPDKLFIIERSKNADQAHYDARTKADGTLDPGDPVDGYFLNKNPDGSWVRADFTWFQKRAYGWDTEGTGNGTYALKLRAFHDRPMWIVKHDGHWRVQTTVGGKQAYLKKLYVATDESGVIPRVRYVDVYGEDATSGAALTEHLENH